MKTFSVISPLKLADKLSGKLLSGDISYNTMIVVAPHTEHMEYEINSSAEIDEKTYRNLSVALADFLCNECRKNYLLEYVNTKITSLTNNDINNLHKKIDASNFNNRETIKFIGEEIFGMISTGNTFSTEGFFNFRMQAEKRVWKAGLEIMLDEIMTEREYESFIGLMKLFLEVQSPKADIVHLFESKGSIKICDEALRPYDTSKLKDIAAGSPFVPWTGDDLAVSILLALAPRVLIIHQESRTDSPALKTIRMVFKDRICSN